MVCTAHECASFSRLLTQNTQKNTQTELKPTKNTHALSRSHTLSEILIDLHRQTVSVRAEQRVRRQIAIGVQQQTRIISEQTRTFQRVYQRAGKAE